MKTIKFKVSEQRTEVLPLGVYRRLDSDPDAHTYFVAHYLVDEDGAYLLAYDEDGVYIGGLDDAYEVLDRLPLKKITELMDAIKGENEEAAVPKP